MTSLLRGHVSHEGVNSGSVQALPRSGITAALDA